VSKVSTATRVKSICQHSNTCSHDTTAIGRKTLETRTFLWRRAPTLEPSTAVRTRAPASRTIQAVAQRRGTASARTPSRARVPSLSQ
jgi:hypothetical protein